MDHLSNVPEFIKIEFLKINIREKLEQRQYANKEPKKEAPDFVLQESFLQWVYP